MLALIHDHIERFGLHVRHVCPDEPDPCWSYSIGLFKRHGHAELYTSGLPPRTAQLVFNDVARRVAAGLRLADGSIVDDLLNAPVVFKAVPPELYGDDVGLATLYYGGRHYPLLQMVWDDVEGRFPWEPGYVDDPPQDLLYVRGGTRGHGRRRAWA